MIISKVKLIVQNNKIIYVKLKKSKNNFYFRDSLKFFPISLNSLCEIFSLRISKTFFPYSFHTLRVKNFEGGVVPNFFY
jgi:hypothetical protein